MSIQIPAHRTSITPEILGEYRVREVLSESEMPQIYTITTSFNQDMLAYVAEEKPKGDWVVLAPCGPSIIAKLKAGRTSVRDALISSWIWLAFLDAKSKWTKLYAIEISDLPEKHLPRPGVLLHPNNEKPAEVPKGEKPKFEPRRLAEYTDEAIFDEIRRVAKLVNASSLSSADFKRNARVGYTTILRRFGDWRNALAAAGLERLYQPTNRKRSKEEIIEELKRAAASSNSSTLTIHDFESKTKKNAGPIRKVFGNWRKALDAAGLHSVNSGKRYDDAECYENLLRVWTLLGRPPLYREMNGPLSTVGGKAYVTRWGTWNKAIHAFTIYAESDAALKQTAVVSAVKDQVSSKPKRFVADSRDIPLGLRYRVLKRDHFKCTLCGRSPARDPECELHVDHIIPFAKGGKTTEENLRTLCKECNLGKGTSLPPLTS